MSSKLLLFFLLIMIACDASAQTSAYGKPSGFVRINIPASSQELLEQGIVSKKLVSIPFTPIDTNINNIFQGQLTGESTEDLADKVSIYNVATQSYNIYFKADNTGDSEKNGKFFSSDWTASTVTLTAGMAFWIQNYHTYSQNVFLGGHLVLENSKTLSLYPQANLVAYPFSSRIALNSTDLKNDGAHGATTQSGDPDVLSAVSPDASYWLYVEEGNASSGNWFDTNNVLANTYLTPGRGYWYNRQLTSSFNWSETRPYGNPFNVTGASPTITGMTLNQALDQLTLSISCTGESGEVLEIFFKDLSENDSLVTESGWQIAAVGLATNSSTSISWTDEGVSSPAFPLVERSPVTTPYMRIYMVSRQDADMDGDGLSDGEEKFVYGTSYLYADSDLDGLLDGAEVITHGTDPLLADSDADGFDDYQEINVYGTNPNSDSSVPSDSAAPSIPASLTLKAKTTSCSAITWTASTDTVGVEGYVVYRDGFEIGRTKETRFVDYDLTTGCGYSYTVKAYDNAGNISDASTALAIETRTSGVGSLYVDVIYGDDSNSGTSKAAAKRTIQAALDAASAGNVIIVAEGLYSERLNITKDVVIIGEFGNGKTVIDSEGLNGRAVEISGTSELSCVIEGISILGGTSTSNGGGIYVNNAAPVIVSCVLMSNSAVNGGGAAVSGVNAYPVFVKCSFTGNIASSDGGGIYFNNQAAPVIKACGIYSNGASVTGGGIYGE
ncbi:MAG: hypothetical protein A2020_11115 [Lentisphaerae bacterium GWF2_45_14]|nr:MAG: hypothetical protein A2020_11115 [Lentisphaerae bacterium GWF2_45_14]